MVMGKTSLKFFRTGNHLLLYQYNSLAQWGPELDQSSGQCTNTSTNNCTIWLSKHVVLKGDDGCQ